MKPSKTSQSHSQETPSATQAQFGDLWPVHNRWFGAVMSECRRYFDGDLDQVLILTIIGTRSVYPKRLQGISYEDFRRGLRNDGPVMPINTQSVADSTGIPRESVRRKIGQLIERGWVERREDGYLRVTERTISDLSPITKLTLVYFEELQRLMAQKNTG
jgi:DNA-binding transcriptional ArsR family regulator